MATAQRFANTQISNFNERLEALTTITPATSSGCSSARPNRINA